MLVAYGKHEVLEGDPIEGIVIAKFPDVKAAKDWYYSEAYQVSRSTARKGQWARPGKGFNCTETEKKSMNDAITPFTLAVPQADLEDLNRRIDQTRWPDAETVDN